MGTSSVLFTTNMKTETLTKFIYNLVMFVKNKLSVIISRERRNHCGHCYVGQHTKITLKVDTGHPKALKISTERSKQIFGYARSGTVTIPANCVCTMHACPYKVACGYGSN